jgi:hypothetical protein
LRLLTTAGDGVFCALALLLPLPRLSHDAETLSAQVKR